jgi:head-tail adaptor
MFDPLVLNPGELIHQIQIQAADTSQRDAAGQATTRWNLVLETWAKIESAGSISYRMSFSGSEFSSQSTDLMTIRWPGSSITVEPDQRVVMGNNIWTIQGVDNIQHRNRVVRLACLQVDADSN